MGLKNNVIIFSVPLVFLRILKILLTDFYDIFWRCGAWLKEESDFGVDPDSFVDPG